MENSRWRRIVLNGASGGGVSQAAQGHRLAGNEEATLSIIVQQPPNKEAENNRFTVSHSSWRSQKRSVSGSGLAGWFRFGGLSQGCSPSADQKGRYE